MKKKRKLMLATTMAALLSAIPVLSGCGGGDGKIHIEINAANSDISFISTSSMEQSVSNPYPYNTLEVLADEYMEAHPDVVIEIYDTPLTGASAIKPLLKNAAGPHLLLQTCSELLSDAENGYYYDLTDAFAEPNPYCEEGSAGSEHWQDLYNPQELLATRCANERYYSVCLDKIPIGMVYNKTYFEENQLEVPETYADLIEVLDAIKAKGNVKPYVPLYNWYDIYLEVSIFGERVLDGTLDCINRDGFVSSKEMLKCYYEGTWTIPSSIDAMLSGTEMEKRYVDYINKVNKLRNYYAVSDVSGSTRSDFLNGTIAVTEATGQDMVRFYDNEDKDFEVGIMAYPTLEQGKASDNKSTYGGYGAYRGTAGLASSMFITNRAMEDGRECVAACVDFLRFLTAPAQNDRLIRDRGFSIPLAATSETAAEVFKPLVLQYEKDLTDEKRLDWNAYNSWYKFDDTYYNNWLDGMESVQSSMFDLDYFLSKLVKQTEEAALRISQKTGWTRESVSEWGKVDG